MNPTMTSAVAPRQYIGELGPTPNSGIIKAAVRLGAECAAARGLTLLTMAIPTLGHLQGMIEDLFGEDFTRLASRDYRVDLDGFVVHLATRERPPRQIGPIVAVFTQPDQTKALVSNRNTTDFVYVPWTADDVAAFQRIAPTAERF